MSTTQPAPPVDGRGQTADKTANAAPESRQPQHQPKRSMRGVPLRPPKLSNEKVVSGASMFGWLFGKP